MEVPLDREDSASPTITVRIARQAADRAPAAGAIFQIAGGPGGSSVNQSGLIPQYLPLLSAKFDLVYVDQRGTGGSGYLDCPGGYPSTEKEWETCGAAHAGEPLNHLLSLDAARDLEAVRKRLGYGPIHLRAGSYGTRVALEFLRQYPESVASAVLDGTVPPDGDFFGDLAREFDLGIDWLVADCAEEPECAAVSPSLGADLAARRELLSSEPRPIMIGGSPGVEDEEAYLIALEASLYDADWRYRVPRAIHADMGGDHFLWDELLSDIFGVAIATTPSAMAISSSPTRLRSAQHGLFGLGTSYVAPALWMTVVCAEAFPNAGGLEALFETVASATWPSNAAVEYAKACAAWDVGAIAATMRVPVVSDANVLVLSGGLDLITTPASGEHTAATLANGTHLVVPYAFHGTLREPCAGGIITDFFDAGGDISNVDTSCLEKLTHPDW
jgi:pimeloyl-ACP methyl ester carboxylesterase